MKKLKQGKLAIHKDIDTEESIEFLFQLLEKCFPKVFEVKNKLQPNVWNYVETKCNFNYLIFGKNKDIDGNYFGYGYNYFGNEFLKDVSWFEDKDIKSVRPATPKEVQTALENEAKKRGFKEDCKYRCAHNGTIQTFKSWKDLKFNMKINNFTDGYGGSIFNNGTWATPIETITKEEAEKQLGKVIL